MRKRIVIGVLAIIAVGVLAYVLSQPKRGTVEYHKNAYLDAHDESGALEQWIKSRAPRVLREAYLRRRWKRVQFHWQALLESGYLTKQEFVVSNQPPRLVASAVWGSVLFVFTNDSDNLFAFSVMRQTDTNVLTVTAPTEAMNKWRELIREADVPENVK